MTLDISNISTYHLDIRQATLSDAFAIYAIIKANSDNLILRPIGDIVRNIDRFTVAKLEGEIVACASYTVWPEPGAFEDSMVELTSVVVKDELRGKGLGARFVKGVIARIAAFGAKTAIVLTYAPNFFAKLGFREVPKTEVMHKIYSGCVNCAKHVNPFTCPEVAMELRI